MKNIITYTIGLCLFLGLCYLIGNLTLKNLLSEERLRVMLIEPAQDQLGRQVEIGAIKVSLWSGIDINDIVVKEKNPAQDFVSIGTFRIKYELLPLFEKRLVIKELLIDRPTIRITKDDQGTFNFADLSLKPKTIIKDVPPPEQQTVEPLPVTLVFDQIKINDLNLTFTDQSGKLPTIISTDGDLTCAVSLGKTLPEARYSGTLELVVNGKYQEHHPVLLLKSNFDNQQLTFNGELSAELDRLQFDGQLLNRQTAPDLTLNLEGTNFNLANLLDGNNPASKTSAAPPPSTQSNPAPNKTNPAPPKLHAHGLITVSELRYDKMAMQKFNLSYTFADSILDISTFSGEIFGGAINGKLGIDLSRTTPGFRGQIKADKLQLAAAMTALDKPKDYLTGDLSADFSGRGSGHDWPEIKGSLDGKGKFTIVRGGLASSPLSQALAGVLGIPELNNFKFDKLAGSVKIADGLANLDANLSSRPLAMQTKGSVGLNGSLELPLILQLSPEYSRRLQERAAFARYLSDPSGRTTLNLKLKGTVNQPDLSLSGEGVSN
ncbi:MAG: AsmA family protein, partial [Desulfobulbaceae bacterium]|nr:AsmA family protein [Desulfobulbaceae bacterium]